MMKKVHCKLIEHSILKEKLNMRLYKIIRINFDINSDINFDDIFRYFSNMILTDQHKIFNRLQFLMLECEVCIT